MPLSIITAAAIAIVCLLVLLAITNQSMSMLSWMAVALVVVYLAGHPATMLVMIIMLWQSGITLPWLPMNINLFMIFSILFAALMIFVRIVKPVERIRHSPVTKWIILFTMILIVTIAVRGIGVRVLGSALWGGANYVLLFSTIVLYLASLQLPLTFRLWRKAILGMFLLSLVPLVAQAITTLTNGAIIQHYLFVQRLGFAAIDMERIEAQHQIIRFQSLSGLFMIMMPLMFLQRPFQGHRLPVTAFFWIAGWAVTGLGGFRSVLVISLLIPIAWLFLGERTLRWGQPIVLLIVMAALVCFAALHARYLPDAFQRTLSFIPFADVSARVMLDAAGTTAWRLEVWRRAIAEVLPHYLWIGQGLAFNPRELQEIMSLGIYPREWAFVTRSYHNGPLSLILVLGIPGAIVGFGFLGAALREYYRVLRADWPDKNLFLIYRVLFAWFFVMAFFFVFVYGDVQTSFPQLFVSAMLLEGLSRTREADMSKRAVTMPLPADSTASPIISPLDATGS